MISFFWASFVIVVVLSTVVDCSFAVAGEISFIIHLLWKVIREDGRMNIEFGHGMVAKHPCRCILKGQVR